MSDYTIKISRLQQTRRNTDGRLADFFIIPKNVLLAIGSLRSSIISHC